jgi:hypothetical protein
MSNDFVQTLIRVHLTQYKYPAQHIVFVHPFSDAIQVRPGSHKPQMERFGWQAYGTVEMLQPRTIIPKGQL